jgi:hypothetical protein
MKDSERYRTQAEELERRSRRAATVEERETYANMARSWRALASDAEQLEAMRARKTPLIRPRSKRSTE